MKRFMKLIAVSSFVIAGLGLVATSPAVAGTAHGNIRATAPVAAKASPAACNPNRYYPGSFTFTFCTGEHQELTCIDGRTGTINSIATYASNGCDVQLWLYLSRTPSGTIDLCVNPGTSTGSLHQEYQSFQVSHDQNNCGS